jgi:hypothetical protein
MPGEERHIIRTQSLDFTFAGMVPDVHIQDRIAGLFYERLQPRMEELFDEVCGPDHLLTIDRLEIDGGILPAENWEQQWLDNVMWNLKQELSSLNRKKRAKEEWYEAFFYFLQYGHLPWNARITTIREFEERMIIDRSILEKLAEVLRTGNAIKRLIKQFSPAFIQKIIAVIVLAGQDKGFVMQQGIRDISMLSDRSIQEAFFYSFVAHEENVRIEEMMRPATAEQKLERRSEKPTDKKQIFIHNAGLVILHPFLPALFELLELTKENAWVSEESIQTALQVTEYLVSGKEEWAEFDIPLNMILCGMEHEEVPESISRLTEKMKEACSALLEDVIEHWSALKSTGIEVLRETFLMRPAKLSETDNGWLLQVEQRTIDILLGRLPWGIGVIRTPWMKKMLHVEWA